MGPSHSSCSGCASAVQAPGFRLTSDRPLKVNGRDYQAPLDLVRHGVDGYLFDPRHVH